jgi:small subunit ribosomal protein S6
MENYELTVVLPEGATAAKKKNISGKIEKIVNTLKGKVKKTDDWGEIEFAYEIKNKKSGIFLFYELELSAEAASDISDKLRLEEDIIRQLLVKIDK